MPTFRRFLFAVTLVPALLAPPSHAAGIPAAEIAKLAFPSDVALSPDGRTVAFLVATASFDSAAKPSDDDTQAGWTRERQIWIAPLAGGPARELTHAKERAGEPVWSRDGRELLFVRSVKGTPKLQRLPLDGGDAQTIPTGDVEPGRPRLSPDGRWIAFTAPSPTSEAERRARWKTGGVIAWDREWRGERLWVVAREGGEPRAITNAIESVADFEWSPDGTRFAVLVASSGDPYEVSNRLTPRIVSARDGAIVRTLERAPGFYVAPRWSPDGRSIALLVAHESLSLLNALRLYDVASGAARDLAPDRDRAFGSIAWSPDSRSVYARTLERTTSALERFAIEGGAPVGVGPADVFFEDDFELLPDGTGAVALASTNLEPTDVRVLDFATRRSRTLTRLNPQVAGWPLGPTERVRWRNAEGIEIEGLLTLPRGLRAGARPPLYVNPHGGPDEVSSERFSATTQFFASNGYAVLRPNYRGGFGYGHAFYAANRGRFGEIEQMDIESGVDALIAAGRVDPARLFFGGWSWGGYISAWTLTHVQRYRAFVVGAGVNDVFVQYSVSDINHGVAAEWEYLGNPWRETANFDRVNPIRFVRNAKTPTLILHGEEDDRVGFVSSVELYRALSDLGVETEFHAYPRERHPLLEPAHQVHRFEVWLDWFARHGGPGPRRTATRAN